MDTTTKDADMLLKSLRARLAEINEREARLPMAICRTCGGVVAQGSGAIEPASPWERFRGAWAEIDARRTDASLPVILGWRRSHAACANGLHAAIRGLTGETVTDSVAADALSRMLPRHYLAMHVAPQPEDADRRFNDPKSAPWAHVDNTARGILKAQVQRSHDSSIPRRCKNGACAWCGVARSISWHTSPERWENGSPAPLCADCYAVWRLRGRSSDIEDLRGNALEALSGAAWFGMTGSGIQTYNDLATGEYRGTEGRWEYAAEPLTKLRENARLKSPESLPGDIRAEYRAKASGALREHRELLQRIEQETADAEARARAEAAAEAGWRLAN